MVPTGVSKDRLMSDRCLGLAGNDEAEIVSLSYPMRECFDRICKRTGKDDDLKKRPYHIYVLGKKKIGRTK